MEKYYRRARRTGELPGFAALILIASGYYSYRFYREGDPEGAIWMAAAGVSVAGGWSIWWFFCWWRPRRRR